MLQLYNTLTRRKEQFKPLEDNLVRMYSCGPTVYDYPHIGNLRTYITVDILKRTLLYNGYTVKHVMNITDVGHLTSDEDEGEDKLEKGAAREKKTVWEVAQFYTDIFEKNLEQLNILPADILAKATDHIPDCIALIEVLQQKSFTYETDEAVYFDVSKFPDYTKFSGQSLEDKKVGARHDVHVDPQKHHPQDFALWFKLVGKFANHTMHWPSPWSEGFPGWHIECSAMSQKYLGETFDIHLGGVDHIATHHTNEIAQSEAATGKPLARFWLHGEFLLVEGKKMAKSAGTFITLDDICAKYIDPMAFRLLVLQAHYHSKLNFTWESLSAAKEKLSKIEASFHRLLATSAKPVDKDAAFTQAIADDLSTPRALAIFFEHISRIGNANFDQGQLRTLLLDMDKVLGLGLEIFNPPGAITYKHLRIKNHTDIELSDEIVELIYKREEARKAGQWQEADSLRNQLTSQGYALEDGKDSIIVKLNT